MQQLTRGGSKEAKVEYMHKKDGMEREWGLWRAGTRRHANNPMEPRSAVIAWSLDRALRCLPHANPQTVATLLRAQFRCATSIMAARSDSQVRECLTAAYRRAGLPAPATTASEQQQQQAQDEQPPQQSEEAPEGPAISLDRERGASLIQTMTTQTQIMTELMQSQQILATTARIQML